MVGRPPQEDTCLGQIIHELSGPVIPTVVHGVHAVHAVDAAGVHPLLLAIGSERYVPYSQRRKPQELLTSANALLGQGQLSLAKYLFIVAREDDPELDVRDVAAFLRHLLERVDWRNDLHFQTCTTIDTLDYSGTALNEGSKLAIAAVGPPHRRLPTELPDHLSLPASFSEPRVCLPGVLAIRSPAAAEESGDQTQNAAERFCRAFSPKDSLSTFPLIVLVDDSDFVFRSLANLLWVTFTRSNPAVDVYGIGSFIEHKHWGCDGALVIDARLKPHHAPPLEEDPAVARRVERAGRARRAVARNHLMRKRIGRYATNEKRTSFSSVRCGIKKTQGGERFLLGRMTAVVGDACRSAETWQGKHMSSGLAPQSPDPPSASQKRAAEASAVPEEAGSNAAPLPLQNPTLTDTSEGVGTHPAAEGQPSHVGMKFGDFELMEELGRGGMGVVYKARQLSLDRPVALKMLLADHFQNAVVMQRFLAEARAVAALDHPDIVKIYQIGECTLGHYFAMEFLEGQPLSQVIEKGPLPVATAASLVMALARTMDYAHGKGIIHRDLKPANVMVSPNRRPVIMDFGIAKVTTGKSSFTTEQGVVIGTPSYMAPEQASDDAGPVAPYSDVYSLGAILYATLTGKAPFQEKTALSTILKVISEPPARSRPAAGGACRARANLPEMP